MTRLAAIAAAALLSGCTIVEIRSDGAPPSLSFWPLGVAVDRGHAGAIDVDQVTLGFASSCGASGIGVSAITCTSVDPRACGVAIVHPNDATNEDLLGQISDQSRAACAHKEQDHD